jgi:hypothetical protein
MRPRLDREGLGTGVVLLLTVVTLVVLGVVGAMKSAASDLHQQVAAMQEQPAPNYAALNARANDLDHRSDRLTEATAVVAVVGMLVVLLTNRSAATAVRARDETNRPLANTSSNGRV